MYGINFNSSYPMQTWQYDMFGAYGGVSPSIMSPNDSMGAVNDLMLFNNGYQVNALANMSAGMYMDYTPMMQQLSAKITESWKQMMDSMSAMRTSTTSSSSSSSSSSSNNDEVESLNEHRMIEMLDKMAKGKAKDMLNSKITIDGEEIAIVDRLKALVEEYRKDPDNAALTRENYIAIYDILDNYYQTGDLSTDDFKVLKSIAQNPEWEDPDAASDEEEEQVVTERSASYTDGHNATSVHEQYAKTFIEALDGAGTNYNKLTDASEHTDKTNVIEIIDKFNEKNSYIHSETLIEAINDDCNGWGVGKSKWYHFGCKRDDAKPFVTNLSNAMMERVDDIVALNNCPETTKETLLAKKSALNDAINATSGRKYDDSEKTAIAVAFNDLHAAIKAAEDIVYGKDK